jgi:hypothetical protein
MKCMLTTTEEAIQVCTGGIIGQQGVHQGLVHPQARACQRLQVGDARIVEHAATSRL